jgi:hypothetical protein
MNRFLIVIAREQDLEQIVTDPSILLIPPIFWYDSRMSVSRGVTLFSIAAKP